MRLSPCGSRFIPIVVTPAIPLLNDISVRSFAVVFVFDFQYPMALVESLLNVIDFVLDVERAAGTFHRLPQRRWFVRVLDVLHKPEIARRCFAWLVDDWPIEINPSVPSTS